MNLFNRFNERKDLYERVFNTDDGKKVLADLLSFCKVYETTFVPGDTHATAYQEGARRVGLRIQSYLNKDYKKEIEQSILNGEAHGR